jgi:hypothetical protein
MHPEQAGNGPPADGSDVPLWMQRLSVVTFVIFCIELGMVLAVLPWMRAWTENSLLAPYPGLRAFLEHNFVRGAVSGLGLVNIWIGIWEAVRYRERHRK